MLITCRLPFLTATRRPRAAPISRSSGARVISSRSADHRLCRSRAAPARAVTSRLRSRSRPVSAATSSTGARSAVGAWIDGAMPFRAETIRGYIAGHASALSRRSRLAITAGQAGSLPAAIVETRFRYNQDFESVYAMVPSTIALLLVLIPGDPDGAGDCPREGARLDHQPLCHASHAHRISAWQTASLRRRRHGQFRRHVLDGIVRLPRPAQGKFPGACPWRPAVCHSHDRLRHADLIVHAHPDRRAVRHRDPDHAASDPVFRHADAGLVAVRRRRGYWARSSR